MSRREKINVHPAPSFINMSKEYSQSGGTFFVKEMERYRFSDHSGLHLTTLLENAISKPLILKNKEHQYLL